MELGESVLHCYVPLILGNNVSFAARAREGRDCHWRAAEVIIAALVVLPLLEAPSPCEYDPRKPWWKMSW